jgi:hypothetical protein
MCMRTRRTPGPGLGVAQRPPTRTHTYVHAGSSAVGQHSSSCMFLECPEIYYNVKSQYVIVVQGIFMYLQKIKYKQAWSYTAMCYHIFAEYIALCRMPKYRVLGKRFLCHVQKKTQITFGNATSPSLPSVRPRHSTKSIFT